MAIHKSNFSSVDLFHSVLLNDLAVRNKRAITVVIRGGMYTMFAQITK